MYITPSKITALDMSPFGRLPEDKVDAVSAVVDVGLVVDIGNVGIVGDARLRRLTTRSRVAVNRILRIEVRSG